MDVGKSFAFVFEDKDWIVKILIAGLILLVGIAFFWLLLIPTILAVALLAGYAVEITRRVIRGNPMLLPEWENWGALIVDGLKVIVILLVYSLPAILVSACLGVPAGILGDDTGSAAAFANFLSAMLGLFNFLWAIVLAVLTPAAIGRYADTDELSEAFRFGQVWALVRHNLGTYVITALMIWVASLIGQLGWIVCLIGWLATMPYYMMVSGHLQGQAYVVARSRSAQPAEP